MDALASSAGPRQRGNTLLMVLLTIAVLSVVASNLMWSATTRYHTTYQSASWQEALVASEAGVNLAMVELRKRVKAGDRYAFQAPWVLGNQTVPAGSSAATPTDKRLLGGAVDPTQTATCYDPVIDPSMSHVISLTPSYPENGHALPLTAVASHGGEGNNQLFVRVYVDVPGSPVAPATTGTNFAALPPSAVDSFMNEQSDQVGFDARSYWWYRIRSMGITGLSGPPRPSADSRDNVLRRFSFFTDWRTNLPVDSFGPQVSRLVEAVAKPLTGFRNAIMADVRIDLKDQSVLIDSYNSTYGIYGSAYTQKGQTVTNIGTMGNIATNGTLINAGDATVRGDAMTDDGSVENADNVSGNRRSDFYQELTSVPAPSAGTESLFTLDGSSLNGVKGKTASGGVTYDGAGNYQIAASPSATAPARVYLNGINFSGGPATLEFTGAPDSSSTYVKLIVNGDIQVNSAANPTGSNAIILDNGVHAIVYVNGNVSIQGAGIANVAKNPDNLLINGVAPSDTGSTAPTINIQSTQDFQGVIYAPNHDLTLALQAASAGGTGLVGSLANPVVANLQTQVNSVTAQLAILQADYASNWAKYQKNGDQGNYKKAMADVTQITQLQTQLTSLTKELDTALGNILPDDAAEVKDHAAGYSGIYGAYVGHTITVGSKTHVHYDEALRQAGPVNHYSITNWLEDNASHAANR